MSRLLLAAVVISGTTALAQELPVPPVPPDRLPFGETAPVPNLDASAPSGLASDAPTLAIRQFRTQPYGPGLGFAPGSRYESSEDRKPIQTPGLSINVPLK
jgi:hypothetical protein